MKSDSKRNRFFIVIMFSLVCNNLEQKRLGLMAGLGAFCGFGGRRRFLLEEVFAEKHQPSTGGSNGLLSFCKARSLTQTHNNSCRR